MPKPPHNNPNPKAMKKDLKALNKILEKALKKEDYETAAKIRDNIKTWAEQGGETDTRDSLFTINIVQNGGVADLSAFKHTTKKWTATQTMPATSAVEAVLAMASHGTMIHTVNIEGSPEWLSEAMRAHLRASGIPVAVNYFNQALQDAKKYAMGAIRPPQGSVEDIAQKVEDTLLEILKRITGRQLGVFEIRDRVNIVTLGNSESHTYTLDGKPVMFVDYTKMVRDPSDPNGGYVGVAIKDLTS